MKYPKLSYAYNYLLEFFFKKMNLWDFGFTGWGLRKLRVHFVKFQIFSIKFLVSLYGPIISGSNRKYFLLGKRYQDPIQYK